jgi:hypothetical protein
MVRSSQLLLRAQNRTTAQMARRGSTRVGSAKNKSTNRFR